MKKNTVIIICLSILAAVLIGFISLMVFVSAVKKTVAPKVQAAAAVIEETEEVFDEVEDFVEDEVEQTYREKKKKKAEGYQDHFDATFLDSSDISTLRNIYKKDNSYDEVIMEDGCIKAITYYDSFVNVLIVGETSRIYFAVYVTDFLGYDVIMGELPTFENLTTLLQEQVYLETGKEVNATLCIFVAGYDEPFYTWDSNF